MWPKTPELLSSEETYLQSHICTVCGSISIYIHFCVEKDLPSGTTLFCLKLYHSGLFIAIDRL